MGRDVAWPRLNLGVVRKCRQPLSAVVSRYFLAVFLVKQMRPNYVVSNAPRLKVCNTVMLLARVVNLVIVGLTVANTCAIHRRLQITYN